MNNYADQQQQHDDDNSNEQPPLFKKKESATTTTTQHAQQKQHFNDQVSIQNHNKSFKHQQLPDAFSVTAEELFEMHQVRNLKALNEQYMGIDGLSKILKTHLQHGIQWKENMAEFEERTTNYGQNVYPEPPSRGLFKIFLASISDETHIILLVFSFISMVLGLAFPESEEDRRLGWIDSFAIFLAVAIVSIVVTGNDYSKEKKFKTLSRESKKVFVKVIRDGGNNYNTLAEEVRVGDILEIEQGDGVPADGLCIESNQLKTDESVMTGEPDLIKKNTTDLPFLLSGTTIAEGTGKMLVTGVGICSEWGKTLVALKEANQERSTPLEEKLDKLAMNVGKIGMGFAMATLLVLILAYWIKKLIYTKTWIDSIGAYDDIWQENNVVDLVKYFIIALTIVVVAVPEGLPLAVTIALAYSVRKMMKDQNLVRHLAACETMGGANNICSDKTGTLTLNQMQVTHAYFGDKYVGDSLSSLILSLNTSVLQLVIDGIVANSKANLVKNQSGTTPGGAEGQEQEEDSKKNNTKNKSGSSKEFATQGNKTEAALLLLLVQHLNQTIDTYKQRRFELLSEERGCHIQLPFSSKNKRMSTLITHEEGDTDSKYRLFTKGASEIVVKLCSHYLRHDGTIEMMNPQKEREIMKHIETMANKGLRTICLAYRDIKPEQSEFNSPKEEQEYLDGIEPETLEQNLICIGVVGIKDPLRPEVPAAIEQCKKSGITVRMITGDNILTAKYIARECGILTSGGIAIEGPDFRKMSISQLDEILPRLQVMARSSPTDKYNLVKHLRRRGNVVAVTGDGTNDAPALKEADVGLSMGLSGTQVAKEASDIIILDDNFSSIVKSVLWGRSVYENIRKFLTFQLTVNIVALILTIVSAITSALASGKYTKYKPPLSPVQMLWINLIMDTFAALALATEPPIPELLNRKPYGRKDPLITIRMWTLMLGEAIFQLAILFTLYYGATIFRSGSFIFARNEDEMRTVIFNALVFCQVFNLYNARKINLEYDIFAGLFKSAWFVALSAFIVIFQVLFINFAYMDPILIGMGRNDGYYVSSFTQTIPLNWYQWVLTVSIGFIGIPYGYVLRGVSRLIIYLLEKWGWKNNKVIVSDGNYDETPQSVTSDE